MFNSMRQPTESVYLSAAPSIENHLFVTTGYHHQFGKFGQNYSCHWWNASYAVDFIFSNGEQTTNLRGLNYVTPMSIKSGAIEPEYAPGEIQYWTLFSSLMNILVAEVGWSVSGDMWGANSALLQSGIPACRDVANASSSESGWFSRLFSDWMCRAGSVPGAIEDLSRNATLSLLSSALLSAEARVNVTVSTAATFYAYNWRNLVTAYALAVAAAVLSVGVGMQALLANGYSAEASFSSILLRTRNPDLDELARGHCLGARPMPDEVGRTVLRFGVLKSQPCDEKGSGHAAFGLGDDVRTLRKGEPCW